jgi:hypothetical protein
MYIDRPLITGYILIIPVNDNSDTVTHVTQRGQTQADENIQCKIITYGSPLGPYSRKNLDYSRL